MAQHVPPALSRPALIAWNRHLDSGERAMNEQGSRLRRPARNPPSDSNADLPIPLPLFGRRSPTEEQLLRSSFPCDVVVEGGVWKTWRFDHVFCFHLEVIDLTLTR